MTPFRRVQLPADVSGTLWLHAMPGRFEPWRDFDAAARAARLAAIVCLVDEAEVEAVSPAYAAALRDARLPCARWCLPMRDFGLAEDARAFDAAVARIAADLRAGQAVLLHCAAGIGRTGTMAACVLKHLGLDTASALQAVRQAGSNPQNAVQSGLIERHGGAAAAR